ncbi:MAG TPA: hypothetical protein PKL83_01805 [bacterium]|nr:hypothetical protein [bacterium]
MHYFFWAVWILVITVLLNVSQKLASRYLVTEYASYVLFTFLAMAPFVPLYALTGRLEPVGTAWFPVIMQSITYFTGALFLYYAIFNLDISIVSSLTPLKLIFSPLLAFIFLGESYPFSVYGLMAVLSIGALFVAYDEKTSYRAFFQPGVLAVLVAECIFAFSDIYTALAVRSVGVATALIWQGIIATGCACCFGLFCKPRQQLTPARMNTLLLMGFLGFLLTIGFGSAFVQNVTITNSIAMLGGPAVLLTGSILSRLRPELLEHHPGRVYRIRFLGSGIMYTAAIGIVIITGN